MSTQQNSTLLDILRHIVDGLEKRSRNELTMASMKMLAMIGEPTKKPTPQDTQTSLPLSPKKRVVAPKVVRINGELLAAMLQSIYKNVITNTSVFSPKDFRTSVIHLCDMNPTFNAVDDFLRLMYQNKLLVRVGNTQTYSLSEMFYRIARWQDDADNFDRYFNHKMDGCDMHVFNHIFNVANLFGVVALYANNHRNTTMNISKLLLYILKEHSSYYVNYRNNNFISMVASINKALEYYFVPISLV